MTQRQLSTETVTPSGPAALPVGTTLLGKSVLLEPLDPARHAAELFASSHLDGDPGLLWRYLPYEPFDDLDAFTDWLVATARSIDPLRFVVRDRQSDRAGGMACFLRIAPTHRVIEIGAIWFGPKLQKTRQSTEALFVMMRHVMDDLGYRRLEWKCDAANEASRRAALRLGFTFEGIFHQHMIVKGRNRDTAWYSLLDGEWPAVRRRLEAWLSPDNFDAARHQRRSLSSS